MIDEKKLNNRKYFVLSIVGLVLGLFLINAAIAGNSNNDKNALTKAAEITKTDIGNLEVSGSAEVDSYTEYKIVNKKSGESIRLILDAKGQSIDPSVFDKNIEETAANSKKVSAELEKKLAETSDNKKSFDVLIWLNTPTDPNVPQRPALDGADKALSEEERLQKSAEVDALFTQLDADVAAKVEKVTSAFAVKLKKKGIDVTSDKLTPLVSAKLTKEQIEEVAKLPEVVSVDQFQAEALLNIAVPTIKSDAVYTRRVAGFGVKTGEIEVGGRVQTSNPYLAPVIQDLTYSCLSGHSTGVAGIIQSHHPSYFGVAPGTLLWVGGSCTGNGNELTSRSTAATTWGARILTNSWGSTTGNGLLTTLDRFYDSMVINSFRTVVFAAGNRGTPSLPYNPTGDGWVTSPALAYNVISVGASDDRNTVSWVDDIMAAYSSWRDPPSGHNDREKPEVTAPGTNFISTTTVAPWTGPIGSGTSYAAPMVAGEAALLMQRQPALETWPESVKAIIMTTAVNDIDNLGTRLSEKDGAGQIVADLADNVAQGSTGSWGGTGYNCASPNLLTLTTMSLTAGTKTRAAIVWDNDPAYVSYASQPSADLELFVYNSTGVLKASSASWDNTYEIVEFTPTVTGLYTLKVSKFRCSLSPRYLGWAWRKGT